MKKNLIKKVFAVSLSIAMACSLLPAANPVTASAAAPYVSLKTTFKTLKVNQSYKMTLKNNTINWKIKKVSTTDKTIATVYGKTTSQVMIKGKSEGRATIKVSLKTSSRKAKNTKNLRCRVKVVPDTTTNPTTPVQTDAEVKTQVELDAALNNSNITKITINPTTAVNFEIKQNSYPSVDLIVDAPLSDIDNSATFKSITINNIKSETWTERGTGNSFSILAKAARLIVDKAASVRNITIGTKDSKVNLVVNGGTIANVNVTAKSELSITGTAAENAALIPVSFSAAAADSVFVTELPVAVSMSASIELTFEKGAAKSTVKLEVAGIKATITNNTSEAIVVTKNDNTKQSVAAGAQKSSVNATTGTTPTNPGTSTTYPGTSVSKAPSQYTVNTGAAVRITDISGTVSGAGIVGTLETVSQGAISFTLEDFEASSPAALQYSITATGEKYTKSITGWTDMEMSKDDTTNVIDNKKGTIKVKDASINDAPRGRVLTFNISVRVKETQTNNASASVVYKLRVTIPNVEGAESAAITGGTIERPN